MLWRRTARGATTLQSAGTVTGLQPAWVDVLLPKKQGEGPLTGAGMRTDLSLSGDWNIQMTDRVNIRAHLKRDSGDLWLLEPETAAGIRTLDLTVQAADENVNLALNWDTERAGVITARVGTRLARQAGGWSLPDTAPLSGNIQARAAGPHHLGIPRAARLAHRRRAGCERDAGRHRAGSPSSTAASKATD